MRLRTQHDVLLRLSAAALLAAGLGGGTALAASAEPAPAPLPAPLSTVVSDVTGQLQSGLPLPDGTDPEGALTKAITKATGELAGGDGAGESTPGATQAPAGSTQAPATTKAAPASAPSGSQAASTSPGSVAVGTPVVSACIIPTDTASPAFQIDLSAAGVDLSSPLIEQIPQAFTACPAGAVPGGDHLISLDAALQDLLGACVRVTTQVAPIQTTLVVLDHNVIEELTNAGLPLDQLAVPCPAGPPGANGPDAAAGPGAAASDPPKANSAIPGLPGSLAFTGSNVGPALATAVGLLCLGSLLVRKGALLRSRR